MAVVVVLAGAPGIIANRVDSQMQQVTALMIYGCKNNEQPNLSVIC
jgi:hypothetical protein